jgi:hypothetical protein
MRTAVLAVFLASCGALPPEADPGNSLATANTSASDNRIDCLIEGSTAFERNCIVETADSADGPLLTVRKPDGGFRRLQVTTDGTGVIAADGAEVAVVTMLADNRIEVAIGADRFRLPARVRTR